MSMTGPQEYEGREKCEGHAFVQGFFDPNRLRPVLAVRRWPKNMKVAKSARDTLLCKVFEPNRLRRVLAVRRSPAELDDGVSSK